MDISPHPSKVIYINFMLISIALIIFVKTSEDHDEMSRETISYKKTHGLEFFRVENLKGNSYQEKIKRMDKQW